MSNSNYRILACDGGGIRGLISAMLLQKLDEELQKEGLSILNQIDLFSGTSTGGLIALGLATGLPISDLVELYSSGNCSQIFTPYQPKSSIDEETLKLLKQLFEQLAKADELKLFLELLNQSNKFLYVKYNNTGLKTLLQNRLSNPSESLANLSRKVLVTTFQLYNQPNSINPSWYPITLDNLPKNRIKSEDTQVLDAALCTSAAPLYFPPYQHPSYGYCVDGGIFANNPSTLALARVIDSGILGERNLNDIRMLSIGTGKTQNFLPPTYQPDGPLRYGPTTWLWPLVEGNTPKFPLISILTDSSSIVDDFQARMILGEEKYQRINLQLTENISLDGCSKISLMESLVNKYIQSPEWDKEKTWVKNYFLN